MSNAAVLNDNSLNLVRCSAELFSCFARELLLGDGWIHFSAVRRFACFVLASQTGTDPNQRIALICSAMVGSKRTDSVPFLSNGLVKFPDSGIVESHGLPKVLLLMRALRVFETPQYGDLQDL